MASLQSMLSSLEEKPLQMTILKNFVTENVESNTDMNDQVAQPKNDSHG